MYWGITATETVVTIDMDNCNLISGGSNISLAKRIASHLNIKLGSVLLGSFANGESRVELLESVRNRYVFIVQTGYSPYTVNDEESPGSPSPNDHLFELMMMVQACKLASAAKVTVVMPCFPYAVETNRAMDRPFLPLQNDLQRWIFSEITPESMKKSSGGGLVTSDTDFDHLSRKDDSYQIWPSRCGKLVANLLQTAGVSHVVTLSLHHPQYQGYFDVPTDNLPILPLFLNYIKNNFKCDSASESETVLVSPDIGGAKRVIELATELNLPFAIINQQTQSQNHHKSSTNFTLVGEIKDKNIILIDDIADTCETISFASSFAKINGAKSVTALIIHGIFSPSSLSCLLTSPIKRIIVTNSIDIEGSEFEREALRNGISIEIIDLSLYFAEIIKDIHIGGSISSKIHQNTFQ